MFSTRNGPAGPGVKNFAMQGPPKGLSSGVRVFKGPTLSAFSLNPFSAMSAHAHFDSFDVGGGYRPSQADISRGVNHNGPPPPPPRGPGPGPGQQQPQSWQVPGGNVYASQQSSHYQQNPSTLGGTHFGLGGVRPSSSTSSRVQEPPPRHAQQPQQPHSHPSHPTHPPNSSNFSIHPGISTDMYIYEASDAYSEYSPSPSPSPGVFSPAMSTDSTVTLQTPIPFPQGQGQGQGQAGTLDSRDPRDGRDQRDGRNQRDGRDGWGTTPSPLRASTPSPSALPGIRQAQTALRGLFSSNSSNTNPNTNPNTQPLPSSDTEFDHIARMNTALNAGYSYYYPEPYAGDQAVPARAVSPSLGSVGRSPRDSLVFYNGVHHLQSGAGRGGMGGQPYSTSTGGGGDLISFDSASDAGASSARAREFGTGIGNRNGNGNANNINAPAIPIPPGAIPIRASESTSSQSSQFSILEVPPRRSGPSAPISASQAQDQFPPLSQSQAQAQASSSSYANPNPNPNGQSQNRSQSPKVPSAIPTNPTYATVLSDSPEPQFSTTTSTSSTNTANQGNQNQGNQNQGYPMPRAAQNRSFGNNNTSNPSNNTYPSSSSAFTSFASADPLNISRRSPDTNTNTNGAGMQTRRPSVTTRNPHGSSPPPHPVPAAAAPPPQPALQPAAVPVLAPPQHPQPVPVQMRVRKDSIGMGVGMGSSSSTRRLSRSLYQHIAPSGYSYPSTNTNANDASNGERRSRSPPSNSSTAAAAATAFSIAGAPLNSNFAIPQNQNPNQGPSSSTPALPEPRRRHSDGDNPSLTGTTRRSAEPFQTEFIPTQSSSNQNQHPSTQNQNPNQGTQNQNQNPRQEPTRSRSIEVPQTSSNRPAGIQIKPTLDTLQLRSVRWTEELVCPSPIWPSQRRKGWFNRRGDQLWTNGGAFRSPLDGGEYPPDLDEYPEYGQGWMNEEGVRIDMAHRLIPKTPLRSALKVKR